MTLNAPPDHAWGDGTAEPPSGLPRAGGFVAPAADAAPTPTAEYAAPVSAVKIDHQIAMREMTPLLP